MNEKIEIIYPSDEEIKKQVAFIVKHSPLKKPSILRLLSKYSWSLFIIQSYLMLELPFRLDIRTIFQQYSEVIVVGVMIIFGLLIPSAS